MSPTSKESWPSEAHSYHLFRPQFDSRPQRKPKPTLQNVGLDLLFASFHATRSPLLFCLRNSLAPPGAPPLATCRHLRAPRQRSEATQERLQPSLVARSRARARARASFCHCQPCAHHGPARGWHREETPGTAAWLETSLAPGLPIPNTLRVLSTCAEVTVVKGSSFRCRTAIRFWVIVQLERLDHWAR